MAMAPTEPMLVVPANSTALDHHPSVVVMPHPIDRAPIQKSYWSDNEDRLLTSLVELYGAKNWSLIAKSFHGRIGKQCRERWRNHLNPSIRKEPFTADEDTRIMELVNELGTKWTKIALRLPGRSDNAIKNRYYSTLKRSHIRQTNPLPREEAVVATTQHRTEPHQPGLPHAQDPQMVPASPEHGDPSGGSGARPQGSQKRRAPEAVTPADCEPP